MNRPTAIRAALLAALVVAVEVACRFGLVRRSMMVPPTEMVQQLVVLMRTSQFWTQLGVSARSIFFSFAAAVIVGFALGVILHGLPKLRRAVEPLIASWYALPFFVLYPLFIVIFGMNSIPIMVVGFLYALMAMVAGTLGGIDRIPPVLTKVGRTYRMNRVKEALLLKLPAAAPHVFTGSKLALGYAVTGVIGSEFILSNQGLGYSIAFAYNDFNDKTMYAMLLFVIGVVAALTTLLRALEKRVQHRSGAGHAGEAKGVATPLQRLLLIAAVVGIMLGAWQAVYLRVGMEAIASPAMAVAKIGALYSNPEFWNNLAETARALGMSLSISCLGGMILGIAIGSSRPATEVLEPIFITMYSLPKVTLYPVVLLFFGIGLTAKVAFGALYGLIPMLLFTISAIRNMNPVYTRTARVLRLGPLQRLVTILIPATVPEIVTGLRISFSITLLGVMIGEMFASKRGLGFMIMNSIAVNDTSTLMAVTVLIGVFAVLINSGLLTLDRRLHRA